MFQQLFLIFQRLRTNKKFVLGALIGLGLIFSSYFSFKVLGLFTKDEVKVLPQIENEKSFSKGFELFDSSTWIKGEKELQVLEIRAIKGQLENDLSEFDAIKSARVILDIPTERLLRANNCEAKASVILTLHAGEILSPSQLCAITYHLSGAIRGLKPNKIAVSDTKGRIYQVIDEAKEQEVDKILQENRIVLEIDELLTKFCLEEFYSLNCHVCEEIKISLLIDKDELSVSALEEIEKQVRFILSNYPQKHSFIFSTCDFKKNKKQTLAMKEKRSFPYSSFFLSFGVLFFVIGCLLWQRRSAKMQKVTTSKGIDIKKLANSLKSEEPKILASMLSYLTKERAEALLEAFPDEVQKGILKALTDSNEEHR